MTGHVVARGPCWLCGSSFTFNPARVPSVPVDAEGITPGGIRRPLCEPCVRAVNTLREREGREAVQVFADSYAPADAGALEA